MGRSCGHCCGCCECSETIEQFFLVAGQTKSFGEYLVNDATKFRCKVVKPANGYSVTTMCIENSVSDEKVSNCSTSCGSAGKRWYLIEIDSCTVWHSGPISCDGALIGIPEVFKYISNADTNNAPFESFQKGSCNMSANFELITSCFDPTKKTSLGDSELALTSVKKPFCENCEGSRSTIAANVFRYELDGRVKLPATEWNLCKYFNVVGVAPKLYETFSHNYEGKCDLPCGPTESLPVTDQLYTPTESGRIPFLRNYKRRWVISRTPPRTVNDAGDLCCPPVISGIIDEHGRLIPDMQSTSTTMIPKPDTCSYCLDGSWHCNPNMSLYFSGPINGRLSDSFVNILNEYVADDSIGGTPVSEKLRLTVDSPRFSTDYPVYMSPKFCCNFYHEPMVPRWRYDQYDIGIVGWVAKFESYNPDDGSAKIKFVQERLSDEIVAKTKLKYFIQYVGEEDLLNPTGAFFRMHLEIDNGFTNETLVLNSHRICPTTDGKIDCNFLNKNVLYFDKIERQNISLSLEFFNTLSSNGWLDDIINFDELVPTITASNSYMSSDRSNAEEGFCITPDDFDLPCNYRLLPKYFDSSSTSINKETAPSYSYNLNVCCCDNQYIVDYNINAITAYPNIGLLDPDEDKDIGKRCRCTSFSSGLLCSRASGKRLAVIITDESMPVYTKDNCICSLNANFLNDLAEFRLKAPNTKIILVQPTIFGSPPCPANDDNLYFYKSFLAGGCPLPEEVIGIVGKFPRSDHITTYDLLVWLWRYYSGLVTGIGDRWYGHDPEVDPFRIYGAFFDRRPLDDRDPIDNIYTGMDIYRDASGSVRDFEYRAGVELFLNGGSGQSGFLLPSAAEMFPTATFTDSIFYNEAWLKYATLTKGGTKCLGIRDDGSCNRKVVLDTENVSSTDTTIIF